MKESESEERESERGREGESEIDRERGRENEREGEIKSEREREGERGRDSEKVKIKSERESESEKVERQADNFPSLSPSPSHNPPNTPSSPPSSSPHSSQPPPTHTPSPPSSNQPPPSSPPTNTPSPPTPPSPLNIEETCTEKHTAKHKRCFTAYNSLAPRTRQTVRTIVIAVVSALALVAIFHLAKLAESQPITEKDGGENGGTAEERRENGEGRGGGGGGILKSVDGKALKIKGSSWVEESGFESQPINNNNNNNNNPQNTSPILDVLSRARPHPLIHPILNVPVNRDFLQHEKRIQMDINARKQRERLLQRQANATEVTTTLQLVKRKVESERKDLKGKALRLWTPGDTPLRILLVGTWRSGSTFLAQALASHPALYQHYEPFSASGIRQLRSGREAFQAQQLLHRLLDCDYQGQTILSDYLNYTRHHPEDMVGHNKVIWDVCQSGPNVAACFDPNFLSKACHMFPIQLVKTVRLRLNLTQLFLNDEKMKVKVVFLVRDPRGTMSSRYNSVSWCYDHADCMSSQRLCADMEADLKVATALQHLYPNRFTMIKYENVAEDPQKQIHSLMTFLGLEYTSTTARYLQEHTHDDLNTPWSTKRKSQDRVALWKKQMPLQEIHAIQNSCDGVLKSLNYEMVGN